MTTYANDTFAGGAGTTLQNHTSDSGHTWEKYTGGGVTYTDAVLSNISDLRSSDSNGYLYRVPTVFTAGYAVKCDAVIKSVVAGNVGGPVTRLASSQTSHTYMFADCYPAGNQFRFYAVTANTFTSQGSYTPGVALAAGQTHSIEIRALDDAFAFLVDGTSRLAVINPAVPGIGYPGVRGGGTSSDSTGVHLDNFQVTDFNQTGSLAAPTLSSATAKVAAVDLAWTSVSDPTFFRYVVEYKRTADSTWTTAWGITGTSGRVNGLTPGTSYDFRVKSQATDLTLGSGSNTISATPSAAPAQPAAYNSLTGTHSGSVTVGQASLTTDPSSKSTRYAGGKTTFSDDAAYDVTSAITIRAIIRPNSIPGGYATILSRPNRYYLKMNGSGLEGRIYVGAVAKTVTASSIFSTSATADVALVYDGTTLQLYNLGVAVGSPLGVTGSIDTGSDDITVGSLAGGTEALDARVQNVEVLGEALTAARMAYDALAVA